MEKEQIKTLLTPYLDGDDLSAAQLEQVSRYLELLLRWNAKMNLTAVRRAEDVVTRHFGESFYAAKSWLRPKVVDHVIDLGSGAGFPGLPMAIYSPKSKFTLVESQNKKATFLKEAIRESGLANVNVFAGRGEDYPDKASLVTMRAVEKFGQAIEIAGSLVEPRGRLGLMIGVNQERELPAAYKWEVGDSIPGTHGLVLALGRKK